MVRASDARIRNQVDNSSEEFRFALFNRTVDGPDPPGHPFDAVGDALAVRVERGVVEEVGAGVRRMRERGQCGASR